MPQEFFYAIKNFSYSLKECNNSIKTKRKRVIIYRNKREKLCKIRSTAFNLNQSKLNSRQYQSPTSITNIRDC